MNLFLNNALSVLLLQPSRYRHPSSPAGAVAAFAALTLFSGAFAFGFGSLWVIAVTALLVPVCVTAKSLGTDDFDGDIDAWAVYGRGFFAGLVATWPLGVGAALDVDPFFLLFLALHGIYGIWSQIVPVRSGASGVVLAPATGPAAQAERASQDERGESVAAQEVVEKPRAPLRIKAFGPTIGTFKGQPIPGWIVDVNNVKYDFFGIPWRGAHAPRASSRLVDACGLLFQLSESGAPGARTDAGES